MSFTTRVLPLAAAVGLLAIAVADPVHAETPAATGGIKHIGLCWLKQPANADDRAKVIAGMKTFGSIPGVVDVTVGEVNPDRASTEQQFDVGIIVTFRTEQDREAFRTDAVHVKVAQQVVRPLCAKVVTYGIRY